MNKPKLTESETPLSAETQLKGRIEDLKKQRDDAVVRHKQAIAVARDCEVAIRGADIAIAELEELCSKLSQGQS